MKIKFTDYRAPFAGHSQLFGFMMNGKKYYVHEIRHKFMDTVMPQEVIDQFDEASIRDFLETIAGIQSETALTDYIYSITFDHPEPDSRESNIRFILNLLEEHERSVLYSKQVIIEKWAEKYLIEEKESDNTFTQGIGSIKKDNKERGARYARLHYEEIKKLLPTTGIVTEAVRQFDPTLTDSEVERVRHKISILLNEEGIQYPFRQ